MRAQYLPRDPRSTVDQANLGKTCGKCHPNAGERFLHTLPAATTGGRALRFVKAFYLLAIRRPRS